MKKEDLIKAMDEIIKAAFERMDYAYYQHKETPPSDTKIKYEKGHTRLVFPMYGEHRTPQNETRISEQELRFAFVETFIQYCNDNDLDLLYSVETPTKDIYDFGDKNNLNKGVGRSAEFDMVIYDINNGNLCRRCLIEFKANNADDYDHDKDFLKLNNEKEGDENVLRYFIEVIKTYTNGDGKNSTIKSLHSKIEKRSKTKFYCYALEGKSSRKITEKTKGEDISKDIIEYCPSQNEA